MSGDYSQEASIDPSLRDPPPGVVKEVVTITPSRAKLACQPCRSNKIRCTRPHGEDRPCARCTRFRLDCVLPPVNKPRGRPPKGEGRDSLGDINDPYPIPDRSSGSYYMPHPIPPPVAHSHSHSSLHLDPGPSSHPLSDPITTGISPSAQLHFAQPPYPPPPNAAPPPEAAIVTPTPRSGHTEGTPRGSQSNMDLSEYLDPTDKVKPQAPFFLNAPNSTAGGKRMATLETGGPGPGKQEGDDPISLFILSLAEAHALVHLFHERLNPHVAVLDAHLHTMEYLRRTSTVLFTAVLACSARFFRKDLQSLLVSHAQTILDRALIAGVTDIGIVQSLMVLTYWKRPDDTSAWRKIGMALRMGYQLYWHVKRNEALPNDEQSARLMLNAERTWYCLFCFDRGFSQTIGLPAAIRLSEIGDPDAWAREHLYLGHSVDMHLAASIELCKLKDHWKVVFDDTSSSPAFVESVIESTTLQAEALLAKWTTKGPTNPDFDPDHEHVVLWCILDFILILRRHYLDLAPRDIQRIDRCLQLCSQIVDIIDILAENGGLVVMQDTASCMTSSLVVFLRKIFRHCTRSQKTLILSLLQRTLISHTRVSDGDPSIATAYVARFIRRILGALGQESRAASPPTGEVAEGVVAGNGTVDLFAELEEFMQNPNNLNLSQPADFTDAQYWTTLFTADPQGGGTDDFMSMLGI